MPLSPEEPQTAESVPGRRGGVGTTRTPQAPRSAAPLPGPRPSPRPAPPRADRNDRPGPGRPGAARGAGTTPGQPPVPPQGSATAPPARTTAEIQLVAASDATAVEAADETVDELLDAGRAPGGILVLTTGGHHPWAEHERSFGEDSYWRQLADGDDVFCAHASTAARIGSRPVVVLAVNGGTDEEVAQALPRALEKAGDRLVVCGDAQRLGNLL